MLYFNLLSSDTEGTDSKYNMFFSKLNSHSDSKFLKIYIPHASVVLLLLIYSCCYSYCYQCLVKNTANLDVINLNKIGMHVAFISPKRITIMSHSHNVHNIMSVM